MSMLSMAQAGLSFLGANPTFLVTAARNAVRREVTVPLDLLRSLIERRPPGKGPERIEVSAAPPALRVGLTVDLYGTKLDVAANVTVDSVDNLDGALKMALLVRDLEITAPPDSPAAMMVRSLDLRRPGNLLQMMPKRPSVLVEADGDRFVIDLLKLRALGKNRWLRRVLAAIADAVAVQRVVTDGDLLVIGLRVHPLALPSALLRLRRAPEGSDAR